MREIEARHLRTLSRELIIKLEFERLYYFVDCESSFMHVWYDDFRI